MKRITVIIVSFLLWTMFLYADSDMITKGQARFAQLYHATEAQLNQTGECSQEFMDQQVKPLLMESMEQGEIWDDTLKVLTIPAFNSFLAPTIGTHQNPFFRYALTTFLASDRFQNSELPFRQKSCSALVRMLCLEEYTEFHPYYYSNAFSIFP